MIRFRPYPGLSFATLAGFALLIYLGVWQLERLKWKESLIAEANAHAHAAPIAIESVLGAPPAQNEYRHVSAMGHFLPGEAFLFTTLDGGDTGYEIIAAYALRSGAVLLVDRGFVPAVDGKIQAYGPPPQGDGEILGLVRASQNPAYFTPKPDISRKVWYARDVPAIAAAIGVSGALPLMIAQDRAGTVAPEGGHTHLEFRNQHLQYALTWFALAATLIAIYLAYHRSKGRLGI